MLSDESGCVLCVSEPLDGFVSANLDDDECICDDDNAILDPATGVCTCQKNYLFDENSCILCHGKIFWCLLSGARIEKKDETGGWQFLSHTIVDWFITLWKLFHHIVKN